MSELGSRRGLWVLLCFALKREMAGRLGPLFISQTHTYSQSHAFENVALNWFYISFSRTFISSLLSLK